MNDLLTKEPFSLSQPEKEKVFLAEMKIALKRHYDSCPEFRQICDNRDFDMSREYTITDIPYVAVSLFKTFDLLSVPKDQIKKTLYSSGTNGQASKIHIDMVTAENQAVALNKIMSDFLGKERRHFIIFDTAETIKDSAGELSSRGAAIRGLLPFAHKISFVLDKNLHLDLTALKNALTDPIETEICFFGFTWLIYSICHQEQVALKEILDYAKKPSIALHIGGWKKLQEKKVDKQTFNHLIEQTLGVAKNRVIDFYGMTEQLGTVYLDCEFGHKHIPLYSELLIRDVNTLESLPAGQIGFIQLLSPLPNSYPGISLLSDDLGKIIGIDDCPCGRKGKYFTFEKRSEAAEPKGCGDTIKI